MFEVHSEFLGWAAQYDVDASSGNSLAGHEAFLMVQRCPVLEFRGELPESEIVAQIL